MSVLNVLSADLNDGGRAHFLGDFQAGDIDIGHHDLAGARLARDGSGHTADGAGAGDQNVLADEIPLQGGVGGVAEGVEAREHIQGDGGIDFYGVTGREAEVVGEGSVAVHADALGGLAKVATAGMAIAAVTANNVAFAIHQIADFETGDVFAHGGYFANELVADDEGWFDGLLGP